MTTSSCLRSQAVFLLALSLFLQPLCYAQTAAPVTPVRWCFENAAETAFCEAQLPTLNAAVTGFTMSCITAPSCTDAILANQADVAKYGATDLWRAYSDSNFQALVAETLDENAGTSYYAVAVVPATACTSTTTLADLQGKRSCHTGYGRTAGWSMPVGYLANAGIMPIVNNASDVAVDAQSVDAFFSASCAAGSQEDGPLLSADGQAAPWDQLCTACATSPCTEEDIYYDYDGTLRGIMEGGCDVAFTQHTAPLEYAADGTDPEPWATLTRDQMRLVCPDTPGCAPVEDYATCSVARVPSRTLMTRSDYAHAPALKAALTGLAANPGFRAAVLNEANNPDGYLFTNSMVSLQAVDDTATFLGESAEAFAGLDQLKGQGAAGRVRWCFEDAEELAFCEGTLPIINGLDLGFTFSCVLEPSCDDAVANNTADIYRAGGTEIYQEYVQRNFQGLVAETRGDLAGTTYYAVAVVRTQDCPAGTTLASLRGENSCHTGYRRTAGWAMPMGYMLNPANGIIPLVNSQPDISLEAQSAAAFFGTICAVGDSEDYGPRFFENGTTGPWEELCLGCKGGVCTEEDEYYDYPGTIRGVMEGACGVAFTKHDTVLEVVSDGSAPEPWSTLSNDQLRLVCPSGGCAPIDDYASCNLARVPSRTLMTRGDYARAPQLKQALVELGRSPEFVARVYSETNNPEGYLFANDLTALQIVEDTGVFLQDSASAFAGLDALAGFGNPNAEEVRWCVQEPEELAFCQETLPIMNRAGSEFRYACVLAPDCEAAIVNGTADISKFGGTEVYAAYREGNLRVLGAESVGDLVGTTYYSVAVLRAADCTPTTTFADLRNKNACSTGYGRTAGWSMPLGYLTGQRTIPIVTTNPGIAADAQSYTTFFAEVCAVGVRDYGPALGPNGGGQEWPDMCGACKTNCTEADEYYDYTGTIRGVMEGGCDVAFTKHDSVLAAPADGTDPEPWATLPSDGLRLLCPSGGCATIDQFATCNLARVPSNTIMSRIDYPMADELAVALAALSDDPAFQAKVFNEEANPEGYLLSNTAERLDVIATDTATFIGDSLVTFQGLEELQNMRVTASGTK